MIPAFIDFPTAEIEENKERMKRAGVQFPICKYTHVLKNLFLNKLDNK